MFFPVSHFCGVEEKLKNENFQQFKVGSTSTSYHSGYGDSLFFLFYKIDTSSTSDYIYFSTTGINEDISVRYSMSTFNPVSFKVDQRVWGTSCKTTLAISGTEIFSKVHPCTSYTYETIQAWYGGSYSTVADGYVDNFCFVWL